LKSLIIPILFLSLIYSCSRQGSTTSKIKISGAGIFSGSFGTTASNGMILYGKSSDGKNFTKILDADTTDLEFPNGVWSFFAIAWDNTGAGALNNFNGTKKCGSSEGVALNGADTTINISLTTAGCSNFSFYSPRITTCRNNSLVNADSVSLCSQGNQNKGYGSWMRIAIPEMKNFSAGNLTVSGNALRSYCIQVSNTTSDGGEPSSEITNLAALSIPKDVMTTAEVFYSETQCDGTYGVDTLIVGGPKAIFYDNASIRRLYVETNENDVCKNERQATPLAAGRGSVYHPYIICNKNQWNYLASSFTTFSANNFELASNIDFGMGPMMMIGPQVGTSTSFTGTFNGNKHIVSNAQMVCPTSTSSDAGVFRNVNAAKIFDITFNGIVSFCALANSGGVAGYFTNSILSNVKFFGAINGASNVGGLVGNAIVNASTVYPNFIYNSHFIGDVNGVSQVGGIVGMATTSGTLAALIKQVSVKGKIDANNSGGGYYNSSVGGVVGNFANTATSATVEQAVVRADKIQGSSVIGGVIGSATAATVLNSYVSSNLRGYTSTTSGTPVKMGGIIGESLSSSNSIQYSFNMNSYPEVNSDGTDTTYGGLVGSGTSFGCTSSYWVGASTYTNASNSFSCNSINHMTTANSKVSTSYSSYNYATTWDAPTDGYDFPRLKWEATLEASIPWLARECVGSAMFQTTPVGSGTILDPYIICTETQFQSMTAGNVYTLKRDLSFQGAAFTPLAGGKYTLFGKKHFVKDFFISPSTNDNSGIFRALTSDSLIKNLNIVGANVYSSGITSIIQSNNGVVVGINNGTLEHVNISSSKVGIESSSYNPSGSPTVLLGGAVGYNAGSGVVIGDISVKVGVTNHDSSSNSLGSIGVGGIAGKNVGTISGAKSGDSVFFKSTAIANDMTNNIAIGGVSGVNEGVIREFAIDGGVYVTNYSANTTGSAGAIVGENNTMSAIIKNGVVKSEINFSSYSPLLYKLIPKQVLGSTKRILFKPRADVVPSTSVLMNNNTESICSMASPITGCYNSATLTFAADSTFGFHVKDNSTSVLDVADWNVAFGLDLSSARIWRLMDATTDMQFVAGMPEVISANGNLEKLGDPFN
jgi:hypothetical protein